MLYQFREESHRFYIIQTGSFKIYSISVAGHEKIMGFYFPGDVIGLDSIVDARSNSIACALEASTVCAIDYDALFGFDGLYSTYYSTVLQTLSIQLLEREKHMQLLCKKNADQRLASFFFAMNKASQNQGCLPHTFNLTMCRADIANYLGVATETVSRLFSKFQKQGLICLEHNRVSIKNVNKLYKLLAGSGKSQAAMFSQKNLGKSP